jgi:hypothetical protein
LVAALIQESAVKPLGVADRVCSVYLVYPVSLVIRRIRSNHTHEIDQTGRIDPIAVFTDRWIVSAPYKGLLTVHPEDFAHVGTSG